jgi:two-component system LytT family sensor kinase
MLFPPPKRGSSLFWRCQVIGWLLFSVWSILLYNVWQWNTNEVIVDLLGNVNGFLLTSLLRLYYRRIQHQKLNIVSIIARIAFASVGLTVVWYATDLPILAVIHVPQGLAERLQFQVFLRGMFIYSSVILVWSALYFGIRFWQEWGTQTERAERAVFLAQRTQLQMLRYQMNPHFLFNALNSIFALIDEDTTNAKEMVMQLSQFLRYSLLNRNRTHVALKDEIEAIQHYVSVEKKRYEDKLDVVFDIEPFVEDYPILSFLIHPLVENAMKYGMQTSAMPLRIQITARGVGNGLQVSVVNSGRWIDRQSEEGKADGTGTGLENVKARLENAYPRRHKLETFERDGSVCVVLEMHASESEDNEQEV